MTQFEKNVFTKSRDFILVSAPWERQKCKADGGGQVTQLQVGLGWVAPCFGLLLAKTEKPSPSRHIHK